MKDDIIKLLKENLEGGEGENVKENIISKIYYNELDTLEEVPKSNEYNEITEKVRIAERRVFKEKSEEAIKQYMDLIYEREGIEAEEQFKLGFKLAVRVIIECLR